MRVIWPADGTHQADHDIDDAQLIELYRPERIRPHLRVNFVTSVDGAVEVGGYSAGLGSPADRRVFGLLRMYPDALLVGAGTLRHETYGPVRLSQERRAWREANGLPAYPVLVIVSGRLELDPRAPVLAQAPVRPIVVTCAGAPADRITQLSSVADVVACGDEHVDLPEALAALHRRGLTELLSEGGPMLFGSLTGAGLVDEVCLTVSPLLAGPGAGRITAGLAATAQGLHLAHALLEDGVLLLRYVRSDARPTPTPTPTPPPLPIAT